MDHARLVDSERFYCTSFRLFLFEDHFARLTYLCAQTWSQNVNIYIFHVLVRACVRASKESSTLVRISQSSPSVQQIRLVSVGHHQ